MRTLNDLTDTFATLDEAAAAYRARQRAEAAAPELLPPAPPPRPRPGRRRAVVLPVLAAATVGLVVAGGLALAGNEHRHAGQTQASTGPRTIENSLPPNGRVAPSGAVMRPAPKGPGDVAWACDNAAATPAAAFAALGSVAGLTVSSWSMCSTGQQAYVQSTSAPAPWNGFVSAYAKGQYDPALAKHGARTTVNGHPAWFGLLPEAGKGDGNSNGNLQDHCNLPPNWMGPTEPPCRSYTIVWEYAPDSWVAVVDQTSSAQTPGSREQALRAVAAAITAPDPSGLRMPMRFGYLPGGLTSLSALSYFDPAHPELWATGGQLRLGSGHKDATTVAKCDEIGLSVCDASLLVVSDWTTVRHEVAAGTQSVPIKVNGQPGSFYPDGNNDVPHAPTLDVLINHRWELQIVVNPAVRKQYPVAELIKIAEQVTFPARGNDQSTWFPFGTVLP